MSCQDVVRELKENLRAGSVTGMSLTYKGATFYVTFGSETVNVHQDIVHKSHVCAMLLTFIAARIERVLAAPDDKDKVAAVAKSAQEIGDLVQALNDALKIKRWSSLSN